MEVWAAMILHIQPLAHFIFDWIYGVDVGGRASWGATGISEWDVLNVATLWSYP